MTPLDALAAAVLDRLLDGAVAPLPGIGTLLRAHVPARIHTREDGTRVLRPPGEAVGLASQAADPTEIAQALVRHTGARPETAAVTFRDTVDQLEARLVVMGEARLPGVGTFQRSSAGVRFAPTPDLIAAVNRPYDGLAPVVVSAAEPVAAPAPPPEAATPAPVPYAPPVADEPDAVDTLLDLIVNEPTEEAEAPSPAETTADPVAASDATAAAPTDVPADGPSPSESAFVDDDMPAAVPSSLSDRLPPVLPWEAEAFQEPAPLPEHDARLDDADETPQVASVTTEARTPEPLPDETPHIVPDDAPSDTAVIEDAPVVVTEAPDRPGGRRAWAFVYAAVVLGLIALLAWWAVQERRADPPDQTTLAEAPRRANPLGPLSISGASGLESTEPEAHGLRFL